MLGGSLESVLLHTPVLEAICPGFQGFPGSIELCSRVDHQFHGCSMAEFEVLASRDSQRVLPFGTSINNDELVGGLEHDFYFSIYWE